MHLFLHHSVIKTCCFNLFLNLKQHYSINVYLQVLK